MHILSVILILVPSILALKDIGELNLIQVDTDDKAYTKLILGDDGFLSAPPLVVLDAVRLKSYECFKNLRSNRWSLGIPIIFWNQTYMDRISESVKKIQFFKKFHPNISDLILPPSGILAYRLNWRRRYELFDETVIHLDSFWYNAAANYVLPKYHNFVMEFKSVNDSNDICNSTKQKLLNQTLQSQELAVDFVIKKMTKRTVPPVKITIGDIRGTKMFNDTKCENKGKCLVTQEYAEKWAYEGSSNIMRILNVVHLSLQKEIFDSVLNNYLCKDKVSVSEIESQLIKRLLRDSNNEMGCSIPKKVYTTMEEKCKQTLVPNHQYPYHSQYKSICAQESVNYNEDVVIEMDPILNFNERNEFTITLKT